jgi:hypothetical protein
VLAYGLRTPKTTEGVTKENWLRPSNMTFHDFVLTLREIHRMSPNVLNAHFMPQTRLCQIDKFPYNYIGEVCVFEWAFLRSAVKFFYSNQLHNKTDMVRKSLSSFLVD